MNFYFYDLETSGRNPKSQRIMQFAGVATDENFNPVRDPDNILIRLSEDILPEPEAVLLTGITPQKTLQDGITEAEFLRYFHENVLKSDQVLLGFNTVRFDDEFMRYLHYRNFYDPYEWQWQDGRSKWDLLDVVRMTRALRPEGIEWPFDAGKPTNRLTALTEANNLDHFNAHDAMSDVSASIALAKMLREKQPKIFNYLLKMRDKKELAQILLGGQPFVYTSGRYPSETLMTTIGVAVAQHPVKQQTVYVYDLRYDPDQYATTTSEEMVAWVSYKSSPTPSPVKELAMNRCPAIAPISVLDTASQERIGLSLEDAAANLGKLTQQFDFVERLTRAVQIADQQRPAPQPADLLSVDGMLYEGFFDNGDKQKMSEVRLAATPEKIAALLPGFKDQRLNILLGLYKARNYPGSLSPEDREVWEKYRTERFMQGGPDSLMSKYFTKLGLLALKPETTDQQRYLLEELQLYGESILPEM